MFDITIQGGTIYDGRGGEPCPADVGITGEKIAALNEGLEGGKRTIDASGKIICPGFVDIHSHSDFSVVINPNLESKIRQGVTTELVGNCGFSACPILDQQHRAVVHGDRAFGELQSAADVTDLHGSSSDVDALAPRLHSRVWRRRSAQRPQHDQQVLGLHAVAWADAEHLIRQLITAA